MHRLLSSHPYYFNIQGFIHSSIFLGQLLKSCSVTALSSNISFYLWIYLSSSRAIYRSVLSIYHLRVYTWSHCLTLLIYSIIFSIYYLFTWTWSHCLMLLKDSLSVQVWSIYLTIYPSIIYLFYLYIIYQPGAIV